MKKRLLGGLLAAMLLVGVMAPAANAGVIGVAAFTGTAAVGQNFNGDCNKTNPAAPQGKGLGIDPTEMKNSVFRLVTDFTFVGADLNEGVGGVYQGTFNVCGWLTAPLNLKPPLGASCISTKGHHGVGEAHANSLVPPGADIDFKLFNIGWKASAGPIIPVTGNYQQYDENNVKKNKLGNVVALVTVGPDPADPTFPIGCLSNQQSLFLTSGVAELSQPAVDFGKPGPVYPEINGPKKCAGLASCREGNGK